MNLLQCSYPGKIDVQIGFHLLSATFSPDWVSVRNINIVSGHSWNKLVIGVANVALTFVVQLNRNTLTLSLFGVPTIIITHIKPSWMTTTII